MGLKGSTAPQFTANSAMPPPPQTTLEVTVVSGEEVWLPTGRSLRDGACALVQTTSSAAWTHVDEDDDCNGYPYWGEAVQVTVPERSPAIDVEIYRRRRGTCEVELVAAARVPVEDFSVGPPGHLHCLSYRLFGAGLTRRRNGIVNITVKRLDGHGKAPAPEPPSKGKAPVPAAGKAVYGGASGSGGGSCCGVVAEGKLPSAAPAGAVMGYPVGFSATGHVNDKGYV